MINLGDMSFSLGLAAVGSGLGTAIAGMAVIGAWKKAFLLNKTPNFLLITFVGAPLSQTIYGLIVKNAIKNANLPPEMYPYEIALGIAVGLGIGVSAWMQGKAGAAAADALGESGKGFSYYLMIIGIVESVALFVMAFVLTSLTVK